VNVTYICRMIEINHPKGTDRHKRAHRHRKHAVTGLPAMFVCGVSCGSSLSLVLAFNTEFFLRYSGQAAPASCPWCFLVQMHSDKASPCLYTGDNRVFIACSEANSWIKALVADFPQASRPGEAKIARDQSSIRDWQKPLFSS